MSNRRFPPRRTPKSKKRSTAHREQTIEELSLDEIDGLIGSLAGILEAHPDIKHGVVAQLKLHPATRGIDTKDILERLAARAKAEKEQMAEDLERNDVDYLLKDLDGDDNRVVIKSKETNNTVFEITFNEDVSTFDRMEKIYSCMEVDPTGLYIV